MLPEDFYKLEFEEYELLRKGYFNRLKNQSAVIRHQTALIAESFIGKGHGIRFVKESWPMEGEASEEMTSEQIKAALKDKRERDALKRINNG